LFWGTFRDFAVQGNYAGITLQLGREDFLDPMNSFIFDGINVLNSSTSAGTCAIEANAVLNSQLYMVGNCGGHGDALRCRQTQFCYIGGSYSQADNGVHFTGGYSFANVWLGVDLEVVNTCVRSDVSTASKQTFIGGQFVWTGSAAFVMNAGSNYFRFINPNLGVAGTVVSGAQAAIAIIEDNFIGTSPFGQVLIARPRATPTLC
jgi:hypothetical protein